MKTYWTTAALLLLALMTAGCNTTRGIGQDVEAAGETIQEAAEEAKEKL